MLADKLRVLVVEDSEPIRTLLTHSLDSAGCLVTAVDRVADALLELDNHEFDLALIDINLADERPGWEILDAHRRSTDPFFVVLSGSHDPSDAQRAVASGAPYLLKPASASALATVLQSAHKRRELSREGRRQRDR